MFPTLPRKLRLSKDQLLLLASVLLASLMTIWFLNDKGKGPAPEEEGELSLVIPQGFTIIPLELTNSAALSEMIQRQGVVNVFERGKHLPLVENLRLIKLSAGVGPLFGALLPERDAGVLQEILGRGQLRGVLLPESRGATKVHVRPQKRNTIQELAIDES